jgi:hypothetical protein
LGFFQLLKAAAEVEKELQDVANKDSKTAWKHELLEAWKSEDLEKINALLDKVKKAQEDEKRVRQYKFTRQVGKKTKLNTPLPGPGVPGQGDN